MNTPSLWLGLQGGIFLACLSNFVLQVVIKPTPHAKSEWNRWLIFSRSFGIPILAAESPLAIELVRLIAQGASKLNPKPPLQKFVPLTPEQFFYLITSLTPKDREASLPQRQADATSTSIIALMLTAARGFRFGELGPRDCLAIYRSYTAEELFKIPRVDDLVFYTQTGPCVLGSLSSVQAQRRLLCAMQSDPHARIAFRCKKTKPGRPRFVLLIHVHPFGSAVICTKCAILKSLRNRLSIQNAPLLNRDFLFSFPYKHQWRTVSVSMVEGALSRAIQVWNWPAIRPHDFKRGTLAFLTTDADARSTSVLLSVGDHSPDYVAKYQLPPLLQVAEMLGASRIRAITSALTTYIPPTAWPAIREFLGGLAPISTPKKVEDGKRRNKKKAKRRFSLVYVFQCLGQAFSINLNFEYPVFDLVEGKSAGTLNDN